MYSTGFQHRQKKKLDSKIQLFVIFSSEELDLKSFIRAWEPAWNEWINENLWLTSNKIQTSNYQVKVYFLSKFAESHDVSDVKNFRISILYKKVYSWFLDISKFDFFLRFSEQRQWLLKNFQRLLKLGK